MSSSRNSSNPAPAPAEQEQEQEQEQAKIISFQRKKKQVTIHSGSALQNDTKPTIQTQSTASEESDVENNLRKRLLTYRRINDLFQDARKDLKPLLKGLLETITKTLDAQAGSLWLVDSEKNANVCTVAIGPGSATLVGVSLPPGKGIVGWVIEKNSSSLVSDAQSDERFSSKVGPDGFITHSIIAVPLYHDGEVLGCIEVVNKTSKEPCFTEADKSLLEDICTPAAMHIKTTLSMQKQEILLNRLETFQHLHEGFSSTMELDKLLQIVLEKAIELLSADVGSIWLTDDTGDEIECKFAVGPTKDKVTGLKLIRGQGIIGWVIQNKKGSIVEDCTHDPRFSHEVDDKLGYVTRTMISTPLLVRDECIGAIQIINKKGSSEHFTQSDLNYLGMFSSSAALFVKNARLFASENKAKELSALISISKELSSILDVDAVLLSIANLSSGIIPFERATVSRMRPGRETYEVRAISGEQTIDSSNPDIQKLGTLHTKIIAGGKDIAINSTDAVAKDAKLQPLIKEYCDTHKLQSFWAFILKDDQGVLGLLTMESVEKNMIPDSKKELLGILISQCTVALRNADLFSTIPKNGIIGSISSNLLQQIQTIRQWPIEKCKRVGLACLSATLAMVFLKLPWNVTADIEIIPANQIYYAQAAGLVKEILVREGVSVKPGETLMRVDTTELVLQKMQKESSRHKVMTEMIKFQSEDKISDFKMKEAEKLSLDAELKLLEQQIAAAEVKSGINGVVVSDKLDDLIGKPVTSGEELIKIARTDMVFAQFDVPEGDAPLIETGQAVKFKVFGLPTQSFSENLKLWSVAAEGKGLTKDDPNRFFKARVEVPNTSPGLGPGLRPGMTGRGKIYTTWRSLGWIIFHKPMEFLGYNVLF
ncbi:MAG: GAF domain-containing protein [Bdellovibrionota bacterium]